MDHITPTRAGKQKNDAKAGSGFKTAANIILRKLGSPKAQSSKARKQKSKNDGQLSLFEANRHPN